jgi:hypothetical protein
LDLDLSEFDAEARTRSGGCSVANLDLTEDQRAKLDAALAKPGAYSVSGIIRVLHKWGVGIGKDAISNHRAQRCACANKP